MEFSLHQQLKVEYGCTDSDTEVRLGAFRIDVVHDDLLIEIQSSPLSGIRDKIRKLLKDHRVLVVKPLIAKKMILKLDQKGGEIVSRRRSPKKGGPLTIFEELVYFTKLFPHPRLTLEVPLVHVEELRYPGHGRRRRRRENDFRVEDLRLTSIEQRLTLQSQNDLLKLLPVEELPEEFGTAEVASLLDIQRWDAQRIVYCLRETKAIRQVGKQGNALRYRMSA